MGTRKSKKLNHRASLIALGVRSGLEKEMKEYLDSKNIKYEYEPKDGKISFIQPQKQRTYNPDFLLSNKSIIETKGRFTSEDRQKHLLIKSQHPDLVIRFVFSNPEAKLSKRSKTSYADWCKKNGFQYSSLKQGIPKEWLI